MNTHLTRNTILAALVATLLLGGMTAKVRAEESATENYKAYATVVQAQSSLTNSNAKYLDSIAEYYVKRATTADKWQDVRAKILENELKVAQTYYAKREMHREYLRAKRQNRVTHKRAVKLARGPKPPRLVELTGVTGVGIPWHGVLAARDFDDCRSRIDERWADRLTLTSSGAVNGSWEIKKMVQEMRGLLRAKVCELHPNDYVIASRFLRSLAYEAELRASTDTDLLASH